MSYHAYTGIGSRDTPTHILNVMAHIARYLATEGWTLRSGGADRADMVFEQAVDQLAYEQAEKPKKEIYLPWKGFNSSTSELHPGEYPFLEEEIAFAARFHPAWYRCSPAAQRMHTRNVRQVLGTKQIHGEQVVPSAFVVCWTEGGKLKGGTAQAIRIANACEIPVINLGTATSPGELENLVLRVDRLQTAAKTPQSTAEVIQ